MYDTIYKIIIETKEESILKDIENNIKSLNAKEKIAIKITTNLGDDNWYRLLISIADCRNTSEKGILILPICDTKLLERYQEELEYKVSHDSIFVKASCRIELKDEPSCSYLAIIKSFNKIRSYLCGFKPFLNSDFGVSLSKNKESSEDEIKIFSTKACVLYPMFYII